MIMSDGLSETATFELKVVFLKELDAAYRAVRFSYDQFLKHPDSLESARAIRDFFHRFAGISAATGFAELGYLCGVSERLAELVIEGSLPGEKAVQAFADGFAGVASVLDANGSGAREPILRRSPVETGGLLTADGSSDERVLSKVLVIDDDPFSAHLVDACLRGAGFMSSFCSDPEQALTRIQAELPDLIILDVLMPRIDGFDLCRRVRSHPALQFTPIIFVTRRGDLDQRIRGLEVGGNDYISKPFEPAELVARVRSHLSRLSSLREMAIRDGLTRCYNHKYFKMRLNQETARAERYEHPLALAVMDIDHFKLINDTHGHPAGDSVLASLGDLVSALLRSTDVVARYGGEEFGMLLINAGAQESNIIVNRVRERIASHAFIYAPPSGNEMLRIPVTVSCGVSMFEKGDTAESLLQRADEALYAAKRGGRNRVQIAAPNAPETTK